METRTRREIGSILAGFSELVEDEGAAELGSSFEGMKFSILWHEGWGSGSLRRKGLTDLMKIKWATLKVLPTH